MPREPATFSIVGVGASAGGVEALSTLLRTARPDSGLAYVVVTHLGPGRDSLLREILAAQTALPVVEAQDGEAVRPDAVYVPGRAASITIAGGRLRVRPISDAAQRERNPIDVFFASLAEDHGEQAIGVVLSGGGGDGTLGLKAIKEHGGLTVAQGSDGTAPSHTSMPDSAIAAGNVDLVLPVEEIAPRLAGFVRSARRLAAVKADRHGPAATPGEKAIEAVRLPICTVLREQVGHDFSGYKERTFLRRVHRRMQVLQLVKPEDYLARLRSDPAEVTRLFRDLLIGVTAFFRDGDAFEALRRIVVPQLFEGRRTQDLVRVWVPGCSTGEEAYSVAILLREHMNGVRDPPRVQVFATDIDEAALGVARQGRYPAAMLEGQVSPERLRRFFVAEGEARVLTRDVRDLCIFSSHSVIRDPPFSRMDLVSCRNLLIYMGLDVQRRVIPVFHYALRDRGWLFLGTSESIGQFSELFTPVEKKQRIFQRSGHARSIALPLWPLGAERKPGGGDGGTRRIVSGVPLRGAVETRVLEAFAPAHVVVDREGNVVHYSARTGKYLEPAMGAPSRQLLAMARRGLRLELRAALREAAESRRPARRDGGEVEVDTLIQPVSIAVEPLPETHGEPLFLVVFTDIGLPVAPGRAGTRNRAPGAAPDDTSPVAEIERELRETRERLQSNIEEYETALEELKSANEELVSVNEELQSTNEELETSKEEMQSVNEELQTVNQELHIKVTELDRANADLRNLFDSSRIATVFLDRAQMIRSFTPDVTAMFKLIPADRGRPLTDIATGLDYPELRADIERVLATGEPQERKVGLRGAPPYLLVRLMPYLSAAGAVDGVVVTFVDVSSILTAEAHQRMLVAELNHQVKNTLGVVVGIAVTTLSPGPERDAYVQRLRALSRSHDLLSRDNWGKVPLREVIENEAAPYAVDGKLRCALAGPDIAVSPRIALSLGMVVHELATNAAKYGALSAEDGRVEIRWSDGAAGLRLARDRTGDPPRSRRHGRDALASGRAAGGHGIPGRPPGRQRCRVSGGRGAGARGGGGSRRTVATAARLLTRSARHHRRRSRGAAAVAARA